MFLPFKEFVKARSQIWSYIKRLVKPVEKQNMICILCARVGKKTLLKETHKSTQSQSQHPKRLHTEKWEQIQSDSLNSVNSSVQVKLCKETNAIALAEAVSQGIPVMHLQIYQSYHLSCSPITTSSSI